MFEESLQKAPREELVEHIRLQRELIQRLHRRVLELEASLERACAPAASHTSPTRGASTTTSPTKKQPLAVAAAAAVVDPSGTSPTQTRVDSPRSSSRRGSLSGAASAVSPRGRKPAWDASPAKPRALQASFAPLRQPTSTLARLQPTRLEEEFLSSVAPEPRRELPLPYTEKKNSSADATSPVKGAVDATAPAPAASTVMVAARAGWDAAAPAGASPSPSPSLDHPTVLEGIKEINYVLAAHRAGRPPLPLAVVEELEEIRKRLLQGFKQMCIAGEEGVTRQSSGVRSTEDVAAFAQSRGETDDVTHARELARQHLQRDWSSGHEQVELGRVCPRWVSPESSRVVYGESPHRRW